MSISLRYIFANFLGKTLLCEKAAHKLLVKLTPGVNSVVAGVVAVVVVVAAVVVVGEVGNKIVL